MSIADVQMIFVLSDTHIPERTKRLPRKLLDQIRPKDVIFHAGDFVGWNVYQQLADVARLYAVRGNMDDAKIKELLPERMVVEVAGRRVGMRHGSGPSAGLADRVYQDFGERCDVLIFGHSHVPFNRRMGDTLVVNPGSLSWNMAPPFDATYGTLTIEGRDVWAQIHELK